MLLSIYLIINAAMSPCPILVHHNIGSILIISIWIIVTSIFVRIRCCVAIRLKACGENFLFIFGILTIVGQMIGGILSFVLVDIYRLFKDLPACQTVQNVCSVK